MASIALKPGLKSGLKFAAYASLGPITGPCVAGIIRHRKNDPVLSVMYGVLLVLIWVQLPALLAWTLGVLHQMQG